MVKKKGEEFSLRKHLDRVKAQTEQQTIRFRWYVVEVTPSVQNWQGDGHGGSESYWTKEKAIIVSEYFNTKPKASSWMEKHEPDKGKKLEVRRDRLIKREWTEWVTY